jgi:hypothetical protein
MTASIEQLDHLDALEQKRAAVVSAPQPIDVQLAKLKAELAAAADLFRASPWSERAGIRGVAAALWPKETLEFETDQVKRRLTADPREPLDAETRRARLAEIDAESLEVLNTLTPADMASLETERDTLHAALRGIRERMDALQVRVDRKTASIALLEEERESGWREQPRGWPGFDADGQPQLGTTLMQPRRRTQAERDDLEAACNAQLERERADLARDHQALAAIEAEAAAAAERWNAAAQLTLRYFGWLRRKPIAVRSAQ